jgi:hypothetical protein
MELNSSRFITTVGVDVLNPVELRYIFHNRYNSLEIISFNKIDDLLSEKFSESSIAFFSKLWVFLEVFSHLDGKKVDQVLSPGILYWHFNNLFFVLNHIKNSLSH